MSHDLQQATVELLQQLIRFDTVNPPGNERLLQELLLGELTGAGFECELLGAEPERPNLIARLRGAEGGGPTLCQLGHVDTVLADPDEWTHDPWSGDVADGYLWGRGALDMKSQVAAEIAAAIVARALRLAPRARRAADRCGRRRGDGRRARRAVDHRDAPRQGPLRPAASTRAAAPSSSTAAGAATASAAPRRACSASRSSTDGVAGHASMPEMGDNALLKMGPLLERLGRAPAVLRAHRRAARLPARASARTPTTRPASVARLRATDPRLATMFEPMLGVTFTPTRDPPPRRRST